MTLAKASVKSNTSVTLGNFSKRGKQGDKMGEQALRKRAKKEIEELCEALEQCFKSSRALLSKKIVSVDHAKEMAVNLESIRMLLQELGQALQESSGGWGQVSSVSTLWERYLELEGTVKELRNDLYRR